MSENKNDLSGIGGLDKILSGITGRQEPFLKRVNSINNMTSYLDKLNEVVSYQNKIKDFVHVGSVMARQNVSLNSITSGHRTISDYLAREVGFKKEYSNLSAIFGVSSNLTGYLASIKQQENTLAKFAAGGVGHSIQTMLTQHAKVYEKQLALSEFLSRDYFRVYHKEVPAWIDKIPKSASAFNPQSFSIGDVMSASTLANIVREENNELVAVQEIDELTALLHEEELRKEVNDYMHSVATLITRNFKKKRKPKKHDFKGAEELQTYFVHRLLMKKVSLKSIVILLIIIKFILSPIWDIASETYGAQWGHAVERYWDGIFTDESDKAVTNAAEQGKVKDALTKALPEKDTIRVLYDYTIKDTPAFSRKSQKAKRRGIIKANTGVLILIQKPAWCFVEALVSRPSRKSDVRSDTVMKVWVQKAYLDYFQ